MKQRLSIKINHKVFQINNLFKQTEFILFIRDISPQSHIHIIVRKYKTLWFFNPEIPRIILKYFSLVFKV